mgnify:CR=1 FL=1
MFTSKFTSEFQSTPSARRATIGSISLCLYQSNFNPRPPRGGRPQTGGSSGIGTQDFNPRPPRGGRPQCSCRAQQRRRISIHALREEGDLRELVGNIKEPEFQSTPSARRATAAFEAGYGFMPISIHALREEGDVLWPVHIQLAEVISIHALREEGDLTALSERQATPNFNPRPPRGGRPGKPPLHSQQIAISIHALREEGDNLRDYAPDNHVLFQSTPSARRATTL